MNRLKLLFFTLLPLLALCGCYSFTASTLPSHIRTVQIHEVDNKTLDPVLANTLRDSVEKLFRKNAGSVRLVNSEVIRTNQKTSPAVPKSKRTASR